ncbi:MAG: carbonic anhydrase family protein [Pseudomonas sp.]|uniref:carbonic anhydrase n=1 Tax=Pseudomonas sp. TaxID=306 RepID=UPI0033991A0F
MNRLKLSFPWLLGSAWLIAATSVAAEAPHWDYQGHADPSHWGELSPDYATCALGKIQSPIDIRGAVKGALQPIEFHYQDSHVSLWNNGHTLQVNPDPGNFIQVAGTRYDLLQFHFHSPSEEQIEGRAFSMVAHLVHKNATGQLAVVAVLLEEGAQDNAFLQPVWSHLPPTPSEPQPLAEPKLNLTQLLPREQGYYSYQGSLTTPPCSEGVSWLVLNHPVTLSPQQHAAFQALFKTNARPIQPLNGRVIYQ